ncbi:MAG TPA: putative lipopolysaccharide heptosyltransferase III [Usitatibacteraceae bacterium]|nr:putative lipopolysaccharide heptosyltransferase III [Usitatibacteraceae bacterium]
MSFPPAATPMVPDAIPLESIHRALVIKLRHHGDVLLTSPVFQTLKNHAPHLTVDALVYHETREMLQGHPAIAQVHTIDRTWKRSGLLSQGRHEWALLSALRARRYDLVIHLTEHPRGAWLTRLLRPKFSVAQRAQGINEGRDSALWKTSFTHTYPSPRATFRHTVESNLDALRRIGIYPSAAEKKLVLVPGAEAEKKIDGLLALHNVEAGHFIHMHPTSRWFFKTWPAEKFAELILEMGRAGERVVLTAAPANNEREMVAAIKRHLKAPVVDLTGNLSMKELAALTARARAFVGVDSAPMHIAAAMQTPTVALFGPSGEMHWGPWGVAHRIVASQDPRHSCRPCGNDGCGGSKVSECLVELPVAQVYAALNELLAESATR